MAQCKQTPQEFIKAAFTPQIAVTSTPLAEKLCEKNNLNFIELLQPFSKLTNDVYCKDPTGTVTIIKNLKLTFLDVQTRPPQTVLARKLLNSSVCDAPEPKNMTVDVGKYKLDVPSSTPWFESWRDTFLKVQYPSDHEFTKHFLACLLVVSSAESNPVEAMTQLLQNINQIQNTTPGKLPKWFNSNIVKYHVILHDNFEGNAAVANEAFESLKVSYGATNCFLLRMNSRPPGPILSEHLPDPWSQFINNQIDAKDLNITPESSPNSVRHSSLEIKQEMNDTKNVNYHPLSPDTEDLMVDTINHKNEGPLINPRKQKKHGSYLSVDDVEQIKAFVFEFARNCLLPYVEKQIIMLNDVVANKKGVSKSLFSATKRWFSPNKPGASSVTVNNLIHSPDSPELQIRKLGDLYFMFGNYVAAFQSYHLAKRDYNSDQAWLYYAGALEMAALSAFMANQSARKTFDYMEESITIYLNTCKMPQFATRATILSLECLKHKSMYGEAANQLIRMTSKESDLRSALLLEQAAYCFLQSQMIRKYAFHMVLAGNRFSKAAQRRHSLMCYKQAHQVYDNTGWDLATDHIYYTIGRQANNLQHFEEAVESFAKLLKGGSKQSAQQQAIFLKEYLTILENKLKNEPDITGTPVLPIPEINNASIKVLLGPTRPLSTPGKIPALGLTFDSAEDVQLENKWTRLEEMLVTEAEGQLPMLFKPQITLFTPSKLEKNKPVAIINEPIHISVELINSLQTALPLKDIYLLWKFSNETDNITNEILDSTLDDYVKTYTTKSVIIQGNSKQDLVLSLTPLTTGDITIIGICYTLSGSNTDSGVICIKGRKLIDISNNNENRPIQIEIVPSAPCLQVTFSEMNLDFLTDEFERVAIDFRNTGTVPLQNIYMATSVPHIVSNCEFKRENNDLILSTDIDTPALRDKMMRKNHITLVPLADGKLDRAQSSTVYIWVKAPNTKGPTCIDLLIYYENVDRKSTPRYRLVRHSWNLSVQESIAVDVSCQTSYNSKTEEELALAIKMTNLNKVHSSTSTEVKLLTIGMLSKNWALASGMATPKFINLQSQESAHILLKAKRTGHTESKYSTIELNLERKLIRNLNTAYLAFARKAEKVSISAFEDTDTNNTLNNNDGILLLQWSALVSEGGNKRIVYGQTHTKIVLTGNGDGDFQIDKLISNAIIDIIEKPLQEINGDVAQKRVSYNFMCPPVVQHSFLKEKTCIVPVTLLLHSTVNDTMVNVTVDTTDPSANETSKMNRSNLFFPNASNNFCWVGSGKIQRTLKPLSTDGVNLTVLVTSPGIFDLAAHIQVACSKVNETEEPTVQSCQIHNSLIVLDCNGGSNNKSDFANLFSSPIPKEQN